MTEPLIYKIAETSAEFEAIHRLNYASFAEEIPQHPSNPARRLVDRFHDENTYAICLQGERLIGMIAGRCQRPFSLDQKLVDLDQHLPAHHKVVEVRLLAVVPEYRKQSVFTRLAGTLAHHFREAGCDLAIISGTTRQLALYRHLGFVPFAHPVGTAQALYQPMYMTLPHFRANAQALLLQAPRDPLCLLPGPVEMAEGVKHALRAPVLYHRSRAFRSMVDRVRTKLCQLTSAPHVVLLSGSGTLANDAIAAQLAHRPGHGVVLSNGEFGERLIDHAQRWGLDFQALRVKWGEEWDWSALKHHRQHNAISWVWAVACETSTGASNPVHALKQWCSKQGADLCLDAVSAIGMQACDLGGVWLASGVSGKALGASAGVAMVFHDGRLCRAGTLPRYLDLAGYENAQSTPYTQASPPLQALDAALQSTDWAARWARIRCADHELQTLLVRAGISVIQPMQRTPGILSLALPAHVSAPEVARLMERRGYLVAAHSQYLIDRNWLQICLMGQWRDDLLDALPAVLIKQILLAQRLQA